MEELFRFIVIHPADTARNTHRVEPSSELRRTIEAAMRQAAPGNALAAAARRRLDDLPPSRAIDRLEQFFQALWTSNDGSPAAAGALCQTIFGLSPTALNADAGHARELGTIIEQRICQKYLGKATPDGRSVERAMRAGLVLRLLANPGKLIDARDALAWPVVIDIAERPRITGARTPEPSRIDPSIELAALADKITTHRAALHELRRASEADLAEPAVDERQEQVSSLRLTSRSRARLTPATRQLMSAQDVEATAPLEIATTRLVQTLNDLHTSYAKLLDQTEPLPMVMKLGNSVWQLSPESSLAITGAQSLLDMVPTSHANMVPAGIGELLVVKQQLTGYEASDISHVENTMRSEHRSREHKRGTVIEIGEENETITTREEERDQQSTDRNELQREASSTLNEQLSMHLATSVSGSYGPSVQFSVNADLGYESQKEQSTKYATTISKESTQRAASKVSESIRRKTTFKQTDTVEEDNVHEFDNRQGAEHVIGIYQWLDKIFEAQVFNYGQRLMLDFIVPEPAALMFHVAQHKPAPDASLQPPKPFTLTADELDEDNYTLYAQRHDAGGIDPPPELVRTVSKVLEAMDDQTDRGVSHQTADVPMPDGYRASQARVAIDFWHTNDDDDPAQAKVLVASKILSFDTGTRSGVKKLDGEQGSIPVAIHTFRMPSVVATVTIDCVRTDRALADWKLKTHSAIKAGYLSQMQNYEAKVARLKAEAEAREVDTPRVTRQIIIDELKRQAISVLTEQHFTTFGAVNISNAPNTFPKIDFDALDNDGPYIRFFEQAFEWEQMMYVLYPYYWAKPTRWQPRLLLGEADPELADFLRAGAARLVLAVREGFQEAVLHFLETGQVWNGGPVPTLTSPLYVDIVDEIREKTGAPGLEVAVGEPWKVRLPTQLIRLRPQPTLPTWTKTDDGWTPDP